MHWIGSKQNVINPFVFYFGSKAPHSPFYRVRRYVDLFNGVKNQKPATFDDDRNGYPGKPRVFAGRTVAQLGFTLTGRVLIPGALTSSPVACVWFSCAAV